MDSNSNVAVTTRSEAEVEVSLRNCMNVVTATCSEPPQMWPYRKIWSTSSNVSCTFGGIDLLVKNTSVWPLGETLVKSDIDASSATKETPFKEMASRRQRPGDRHIVP